MEPRGRQRLGELWNNSAGAPGKDPLVLADKPFGEWNHLRILMVGERGDGVPQRQAGGRPCAPRELLRPAAAAAAPRADPAADPRRRDPLARTAVRQAARHRPGPPHPGVRRRRPDRSSRRPTTASSPSSTARTSRAGPARSTTTKSRTALSSASPRRAAPSSPRRNSTTSSPASRSNFPPAVTTAWRSATPARATPPT